MLQGLRRWYLCSPPFLSYYSQQCIDCSLHHNAKGRVLALDRSKHISIVNLVIKLINAHSLALAGFSYAFRCSGTSLSHCCKWGVFYSRKCGSCKLLVHHCPRHVPSISCTQTSGKRTLEIHHLILAPTFAVYEAQITCPLKIFAYRPIHIIHLQLNNCSTSDQLMTSSLPTSSAS